MITLMQRIIYQSNSFRTRGRPVRKTKLIKDFKSFEKSQLKLIKNSIPIADEPSAHPAKTSKKINGGLK